MVNYIFVWISVFKSLNSIFFYNKLLFDLYTIFDDELLVPSIMFYIWYYM